MHQPCRGDSDRGGRRGEERIWEEKRGEERGSGVVGQPAVEEMSLNQIMNGDEALGVVGLVARARAQLRAQAPSPAVQARLEKYLDFVGARAAGRLPTAAAWVRCAVQTHPKYGRDSAVTEPVAWAVVKELGAMGALRGRVEELLGEFAAAARGFGGAFAPSAPLADVRGAASAADAAATRSRDNGAELDSSSAEEGHERERAEVDERRQRIARWLHLPPLSTPPRPLSDDASAGCGGEHHGPAAATTPPLRTCCC